MTRLQWGVSEIWKVPLTLLNVSWCSESAQKQGVMVPSCRCEASMVQVTNYTKFVSDCQLVELLLFCLVSCIKSPWGESRWTAHSKTIKVRAWSGNFKVSSSQLHNAPTAASDNLAFSTSVITAKHLATIHNSMKFKLWLLSHHLYDALDLKNPCWIFNVHKGTPTGLQWPSRSNNNLTLYVTQTGDYSPTQKHQHLCSIMLLIVSTQTKHSPRSVHTTTVSCYS